LVDSEAFFEGGARRGGGAVIVVVWDYNARRGARILETTEISDMMATLCAMTVSMAVVFTAPPINDKPADAKTAATEKSETMMPALQFKMKDIDGKEQALGKYHGNVILMVNVASECGLTPQYEGLQKLFEEKKDEGFVILGFPCNQFGRQEPGTDAEIKSFCTKRFDVKFPMFSKVDVNGPKACDLYKHLTDEKAAHGKGGVIRWNFNKFLIDRDGKVIERFEPPVLPDDEKLIAAVNTALKAPVPEDSALAKERAAAKDAKKAEASEKGAKTGA
jgi:glutathione peroxidase